jgi:hypothetical protein
MFLNMKLVSSQERGSWSLTPSKKLLEETPTSVVDQQIVTAARETYP